MTTNLPNANPGRRLQSLFLISLFAIGLTSFAADQVDMQNGDHYVGKVLSVTTNTVVLQNEVLGTVNLPRARVAAITLGTAATNAIRADAPTLHAPLPAAESGTPAAATNGNLAGAFRQLGGQTNFIKDVQSQYLK